jgi:hypothetical protein
VYRRRMCRRAACWVLLVVAACGDGASTDDDDDDDDDDDIVACDPAAEWCDPIPASAAPCDDLDAYWPITAAAEAIPLVVHFSRVDQAATAGEVLALLEDAWSAQVDTLGWTPPLPDEGRCGDGPEIDIFLWEGNDEAYVEGFADNPATPYDDWFTFMAVDPWGSIGGELLGSTLAHELNHMMQAANDWFEPIGFFEMSATFIERQLYPDTGWFASIVADYQAFPEWAPHHDDGYETWFMYGSALYLEFLCDRYFDGDPAFLAALWEAARSDPSGDPDANEPDLIDAIDLALADVDASYADSLIELARWRYYTGARDDGLHFAIGADLPAEADVALIADVEAVAATIPLDPAPELYGASYVQVRREAGQPASITVGLDVADTDGVRFVVQAVPGPGDSDGELLEVDPDTGVTAALDLSEHATRTIIVLALPAGELDPETGDGVTIDATLVLE